MRRTLATTALIAVASIMLAGHAGAANSVANDDNNLWLEQIADPKALDWVRRQSAITRAELERQPDFFTLRGQILAALDANDKIPLLTKMGAYYYNFWQDATHPRGLWRRTSLDEYRKAKPQWENVLDIDRLAKQDKANWVYKGSVCREPEFDRCLIMLSRGGADAVAVREFDLTTKGFVKNGFVLPESKSSVSWRDRNSVFVATNFGAGSMNSSGYPRIVKLWQRGSRLAQAKTILTTSKSDVGVTGYTVHHQGVRHDIVQRDIDFYSREYQLFTNGRLERLDVPARSDIAFFGPQLLVTLHADWSTRDGKYRSGQLLAIDFDAFKKGARHFDVLFEPGSRDALQDIIITQHYVLVQSLDNVKSAMTEWCYVDKTWVARKVALPSVGSVQISALDTEHSDQYFLSYSDYLNPGTYMLAQAGSEKNEVLKSAPAFFDASPFVIEQQQARSKDGTMVPYFIVHRQDMQLDGKNPTLLYGYGGFEISLTPSYSAGVGLGWLSKGGVYVVANIRGGGEFGPAWHDAAVKQNRQRAYDDFAAVAQNLIDTRVTDVRHLGTTGASNGGLLAGVMLTQHPELFRAIVSQVPLLDMRRYNKLLAGASWEGEYGNPDLPDQWAYIGQYSPYQNVRSGVSYPDVLFMTSTRDDRVHPGHARKMAARMLEQGHNNVRYYENIEGGHGGAANNAQRADMSAMLYSWMWRNLSE